MSRIKDFSIKRISFEEIVKFWVIVSHFSVNKKFVNTVGSLGHFKRAIKEPHYLCYGLFYENKLIGVTQISQWSDDWVRYRTINILKEFRGNDLGWKFLYSCVLEDWPNYKKLFGWVKEDHVSWSLEHGFTYVDGKWNDNHVGMFIDISHFSEKEKLIAFVE